MGINCPKCQTDNPDTSSYCADCGTQLGTSKNFPAHTKTLETQVDELAKGSIFDGRYQIIKRLGRGGMGEVYRALDQEVNEEVAIIRQEIAQDESTIERFRNELKIARKVSHRNVCRMFDLGKTETGYYITMEYIEGEDLKSVIKRKRVFKTNEALAYVKQICNGLAEAHRLGILHRDLKPQNVMIDTEGNAKILDFGIARTFEAKGVTQTGMMIGTPDYISPEQVEGKQLDQRSDIYSIGVMLYEMLTGKLPFKGDSALSLAVKHKTEIPISPKKVNDSISEDLNELILKCMDKDKEKRYQQIVELVSDLSSLEKGIRIPKEILLRKKLATDATNERRRQNSIAVLPLVDLSASRDQEYFCDGMTEDIITKLSRLPELKVISRTSVMRYKNTDKDIRDIGEELGVANLLEGSVRKEKDKIRVSAQLIDVNDGFHLWADTYDRRLESIFEVQDEVSQAIAEALKVKLTREKIEAIKKGRPENVEAYEYVLKGMHFINSKYIISQREEDFKTAVKMFNRAVEIDKNYALAYNGFCWAYQHHFQITGNKKDLKAVMKNAEIIYKIDPNLAEANAIIAWIHHLRGEYDNAYKSYKRAFEINPNIPTLNHIVALFFRGLGLLHQTIEYASRCIELDPFFLPSHSLRARCFVYLKEYEKAANCIEKASEIERDNFWSFLDDCILNIMLKKYDRAEEFLGRVKKINPDYSSVRYYKALLLAAAGEKDKALSLSKNGAVYSLLGMKDEAIEYINIQMERGHEHFQYSYLPLINSHFYDNLRDDPRFKQIVEKQERKYEDRLKKYGDL